MRQHEHEEEKKQPFSLVSRWWEELRHHGILVSSAVLLESGALFVLHKYFPDSPLTAWAANPVAMAAMALVTLSSTPFAGKGLRFLFPELSRSYSRIARPSGLEDLLPHAPPAKARKEWADCASEIKTRTSERLRILAFTGAETFAREDAPLRHAVTKYKKDLQILVALPNMEEFERRVGMLKGGRHSMRELRERYLNQHNDTKEFCRSLAEQLVPYPMRSIEVRGYSARAIWKMVAFRDYLWLQHYCYACPVDETPVYIVREGINSSLFVPYECVFDSYWDSAKVLLKRDSGDQPKDHWDKIIAVATRA